MRVLPPAVLFLLAWLPFSARADLAVVTDIPPVQSLVAQVMDGVGEPGVLLSGTVSVHDFALRPSQAGQLQEAGLVVWVGPALTPQLQAAVATLSRDAHVLVLQDAPGVTHREAREGAVFAGEPDTDHDHDHGDGHDHSGDDPHLWLDPENAKAWVQEIARTLSTYDPENSAIYAENAAAAIEDLDRLQSRLTGLFSGVSPSFVVSHDSMVHFEQSFGISAVGALAESDAVAPGPKRVAEIRAALESEGVACLLVDVADGPGLMSSLVSEKRNLIEIDVLGSTLQTGPGLYGELLERLAMAIAVCE